MLTFKRRSIEEYTDSLAGYLPDDPLFLAKKKNGTNLRSLLRGMAWELFRVNGSLSAYASDVIPDETERFIDEWERVVGIPDGCFSGAGTLEERRRDVLIKLAALGVQTAEDFVGLAAKLGVVVDVVPGSDSGVFPLGFPVLVFGTAEDARFTLVVSIESPLPLDSSFPYSFPIPFGTKAVGTMRCMFQRLKPANCNLIIRQVG